jgi:hypothetical protein
MKVGTCIVEGCDRPATPGFACDFCRGPRRSLRVPKTRPSRLRADWRRVPGDLSAAQIDRLLARLDARRRAARWQGGRA